MVYKKYFSASRVKIQLIVLICIHPGDVKINKNNLI